MQELHEEDIRIEDNAEEYAEEYAEKHAEEYIDEEFSTRQAERREKIAAGQRRKKRRTLIILLIVFALMATMCGRDIIRLKAENRELKKQQVALEKQRDELKEELKNTGESEYIREQARKQLRLLNPGEILFTFDDEE